MSNSLHPFVSVIMPIRNEERYIERSLGAVLAQVYPSGCLEVVIVDGNSSDRTRELISNLALTAKFPVSILDNPTGIVPKALNIGLRHAKGEIVIRVDGHCEVPTNYVTTCVKSLNNRNVDCVGGTIITIGETYIAEVIAICMSSIFGVGNVDFRVGSKNSRFVDSVPFPAYRKEIFNVIGTFDEEMLCDEDDEFNYRLLNNKGHILLLPNLRTRYYSRGSLFSLWKQYYKYGFWKVRVLQKYPKQIHVRQFIPLLFVISLLLSTLIMSLTIWGKWVFFLIVFSYLCANLIASMVTCHEKGWKHLALLPFTYAILHISYGFGMLVGLFHFWNHFGISAGKIPHLPLI
jgi:glycosyltransferase involved in cell wall biosynthesis